MQHDTLPSGVSSINLPTVTGGATVAVQATQNTAVSDTAMVTSSVTSGITTIAGRQIVSMQLLQQSGIPFDRVVLGDLARAYATQIDVQVISGSGASGQLRGLLNGAGVGATTFTSATPKVTSATAADSFYNKIIAAVASVNTNLFLPPTAVIMHPNRWAWVLEALDSQVRPLVVPNGPQFNGVGNSEGPDVAQGPAGSLSGLPVFIDPNIPVNLGAGTNEDRVFVLRQDQCWLYESELQSSSFDATYADQASILFRVLGYSAFIPDRYGKAVNVIAGTGLVAPTL
jgi:HK97 family phage major capsid protein